MRPTRSITLLALLAVVGLAVAPVAGSAVVGTLSDDVDDETTNATVSAYMQSSAADAENEVDAGMFDARYEATDDEHRSEAVLDRTDELEQRLADLEAEREELREREADLPRGEYQARMAKLSVEIQSLERSLERTEHRAAEAGVDDDRLEKLRANAGELRGPEVAEIARGLGHGDGSPDEGQPDDRGSGPPDDPGNQSTTDRGQPSDHAESP